MRRGLAREQTAEMRGVRFPPGRKQSCYGLGGHFRALDLRQAFSVSVDRQAGGWKDSGGRLGAEEDRISSSSGPTPEARGSSVWSENLGAVRKTANLLFLAAWKDTRTILDRPERRLLVDKRLLRFFRKRPALKNFQPSGGRRGGDKKRWRRGTDTLFSALKGWRK